MDKKSVTNNPRELGERLWAFKSDQKFCDAYILFNDQRIPVHANVLASFGTYFENMFEANEKIISFTDIDTDVMLSLIEYCYKGTIDINANNALNLLQMAIILGMPSIVENCAKVLKNTLNTENCLSIWKSANIGENDAIKKHIIPFIKENIGEIYLSDDFVLLDYAGIKQIFTSKAKPKSEKTLYDALKRWLNHEFSRKNHSTELLGYINLGCIPKDSIDSSEAQAICGLDNECLLKFIDGSKLQGSVTDCSSGENTLIVMGGSSLEQSRVIEIFHLNLKQWVQINYGECNKTHYATALIDNKIIIIGGVSSGALKTVEYYDLKTGQTESLPQLKYPRFVASAVSNGNEVFAFGGSNGNNDLSRVEKWSPKTRTWQEVAPMSIARSYMGAAVLDDEIFVVGGYNNINGCLSATEAYNPTSNTWRKCKDMNHLRYNLGVSAVNGYLFAVGGYNDRNLDTVEIYDKSIDRWTMIQSLEVKKSGVAAGNLIGQLVITGGYDGNKYSTSVEAYDEKNDKWISLASLNKERGYHRVMQIPWSLAELAIARKK